MDALTTFSRLRERGLLIFTLQDITHLFPGHKRKMIKNNLTRWVSKGYLARLRRDIYQVREPGGSFKVPDFYVANRLYSPSYVSLETALSFYGLIPEVTLGVTSVTPRPTRVFRNHYGSFFYRSCQPRAFTGYRLLSYEGFKVQIADPEKALADFCYYRLRSGFPVDFAEERLNKTLLRRKIRWRNAYEAASLYNPATVTLLKACRSYAQC